MRRVVRLHRMWGGPTTLTPPCEHAMIRSRYNEITDPNAQSADRSASFGSLSEPCSVPRASRLRGSRGERPELRQAPSVWTSEPESASRKLPRPPPRRTRQGLERILPRPTLHVSDFSCDGCRVTNHRPTQRPLILTRKFST
jgi:hypothetical protein